MSKTKQKNLSLAHKYSHKLLWPLLFLVVGSILSFLFDADIPKLVGYVLMAIGAFWATILFIIIPIKYLSTLPEKTTYTKKQMILLAIISLFTQIWAFGFGMSFGNSSSIIANWLMGIGVVGMFGLHFLWKQKQKRLPFV